MIKFLILFNVILMGVMIVAFVFIGKLAWQINKLLDILMAQEKAMKAIRNILHLMLGKEPYEEDQAQETSIH